MAVNLRNSIISSLIIGLRQSVTGGLRGLLAASDLQFADTKTLTDQVSGNNLVTFSRASAGTYVDSNGVIQDQPCELTDAQQEFDQWTVAANSVITPNSITAPDGSLTADRVFLSQAGSTNMSQFVELVQNQTYTFSVYAKAVTPGSNDQFEPYINSPTPSFPNSPFAATSEWQRFVYTFTHTNSTAPREVFILNRADAYVTDVYFWGAQLEKHNSQ